MLSDILETISLGRKLIRAISDLKKDVGIVRASRSSNHPNNPQSARIDALEGRLADLDTAAKEQDARIAEMEKSLKDTFLATEALAKRVSKIFWISILASGLSLAAVILSLLVLTHAIR